MVDAIERLVNLAMFLVSSVEPVTAEQCRAEVAGYPEGQDEAAFLRMFERDKDELRSAGLAIRVADAGGVEAYEVDQAATHVRPAELTAEEEATLRVAAAALATDPSFPFREDLRLALAKTLPEVDTACPAGASGLLADEEPAEQGDLVNKLAGAANGRKQARFGYTNARGESKVRDVEPYGLFLREGRWYLVGRDAGRDEVRTFAISRMQDVSVNSARPKSPDFDVPADFDVSAFVLLPFQYGTGALMEAVVRVSPEAAWRAQVLTAGVGALEPAGDGCLRWRVTYRNDDALLRWIVANGPGLEPVAPPALLSRFIDGLREAAKTHAP